MSFRMRYRGPDEIGKAFRDKNHSGMNPDTSCPSPDVTELEATLPGEVIQVASARCVGSCTGPVC